MPSDTYVAERCSEIEANLDYAVQKSAEDPELGAYLAGYISVIISGVVEDCIEYLVVQRAERANDPELKEFVRNSIGQRLRNPRSEDIANMLAMFGSQYRESYQARVKQSSRSALGSIMSNRLSLAHTGFWQQPSTVNEVREYFAQIVPILETVEGILLS
jgi:hypothetical protein